MKFAQFQSTYKPLPIDVYEQTGKELENKYYRNREQASLFRQSMATAKVEDRNLNILAKATTDVENQLASVNGEWHRASNILYNAKDRLLNDKALNAATEDYQKRAAEQDELQKRFEKGETSQEAVDAYNTYNRFYNTKAIEVDANGTVKNRWANIAAPNKPKIDEQATKLVDILLKNPDSIDSGLKPILDSNGINTGYLERVRREGVGADKIFNLIKGYLVNTPEVKQYYQYINNADLLAKTSDVDENGDIQNKSILPSLVAEYRSLGWNVDNNGKLLDNYQHYINGQGVFDVAKDSKSRSIEIKNAPASLLDSAEVKYLINEGKLSVEDALKQTFLNHKLNGQLNSIAEDYSKFAFNKIATVDTMKDEAYWMRAKADMERKTNAGLHYTNVDKAPMFNTNYSLLDAQSLSNQLQAMPQTPEVIQRLKEQTENIRTISKTFASTQEGSLLIEKLWNDATKDLPKEKRGIADKQYKQAYVDYLTGNGILPDDVAKLFNRGGIPVGTNPSDVPTPSVGGYPVTTYVPKETHLEQTRNQFQKEVDKKIKDGLTIESNYKIFRGEDGKESTFHTQQGEYIKQHGDSWILPGNLNKQGEPIKLQDYIPEVINKAGLKGHGYNPDEWDVKYYPNENTSTSFGTGVIKFVPSKNFPAALKAPVIPPIIVRPDASVKNANLFENSKYLYENANSDEIKNYAAEGLAMSIYGDTFAPLLNNIAIGVKLGAGEDSRDQRTVNNVLFGGKYFTMELRPKDSASGVGLDYDLFITPESARRNQVTSDISRPVATGNSIPDMIKSLYTQNSALSNK